jgi:gliding motility associated protien GldN
MGSIVKYRIKEDWFFDRQRSVMDVRIIGICPVQDVYSADGSYKGSRPLFWIYYPQARPLLAGHNAFNRFNDTERRSFEAVFAKRMFESYIIKEGNVYDRSVIEYKTGLDALLEAERIENGLFSFEDGLWEY